MSSLDFIYDTIIVLILYNILLDSSASSQSAKKMVRPPRFDHNGTWLKQYLWVFAALSAFSIEFIAVTCELRTRLLWFDELGNRLIDLIYVIFAINIFSFIIRIPWKVSISWLLVTPSSVEKHIAYHSFILMWFLQHTRYK